MKLRKVIFLLALIAFLVPAAVRASDSGDRIEGDEVIEGDLTLYESTTIEEGATINGNITVLGGDLTFDGTVTGNIIVFGGDVDISGEIVGQLIVFGGDISVTPGAVLGGECALVGGAVSGTARCLNPISAEFNASTLTDFLIGNNLRATPVELEPAQISESSGIFVTAFSTLVTSLILGAMGYFITSAVPSRMYEIRSAVQHNPYIAGGIGMLTAVAGSSFLILTSPIWIPLLVFLSLICGLGVLLGLAGTFYILAMMLMGWITIGALLAGRVVDQSSPLNPNDPMVAAVGTGIVTLAVGILAIAFPVLTGFLIGILFFVGLGGVILTRIGKQPFPRLPRDIDQSKFVKIINTLPNK